MLMSDLRRDYFVTRLMALDGRQRRPSSSALLDEVEELALDAVRRRGRARERVRFVALRAAALREPGAQRRGAASRRRRSTADAVDDDRRAVPRGLRARVHVPSRRAGRVRRRARRRVRPRSASSRRRRCRSPAPSSASARKGRREVDYDARGRHTRRRLRRRPARAGDGVRRAGGRRDRGQRRSSSIPANDAPARRVRQPPHRRWEHRHDRATTTHRPDHARDHPELACRRSATRCSPRCAGPR